MGFKVSWVGVHGTAKSQVLEMLGGVDTGVPQEIPEAPFSGAEIPGGWFILFANDFEFVNEDLLQLLSRQATVVACQVHEGVMVSAAYGYERGSEQWLLMHDGQEGICNLRVAGSPPPAFEAIRDRLSAEQDAEGGESAEVDYFFDIPVDTAESMCGYRHDRWEFDWGMPSYTVIEMRSPR